MRHAIGLVVALAMAAPMVAEAEAAGTLEQIETSGTIRLGFRENEPPMSFLNKDGQPVGYSIDLCLEIVEGVKAKLGNKDLATEFVPVTAANRFDALVDNKIDILCGATTMTLGRSEKVDFTQHTFVTGASLLSRDDAKVDGVARLQGKKVAVVEATTTIKRLEAALARADSNGEIVSVATAAEGMAMLKAGEVDAMASDQVVLIGLVLTDPGTEVYFISGKLFSYEPFALAVRRNDADFRLVADRVLSGLYRDETIDKIYGHWFSKFIDEMPGLLEAMYTIGSTPE